MELTSTTTQHDLVINQLTMPIWNELCARGEIVEDQLYLIDDTDGFDANNLPVRNVPEPELSGDAANKDYVDRLSDVYQEKGNYLTSHQSLSDYYTKSQTNALSTSFRNGLATSDSLTAYATKDYAATVGPVTKVNNQTGAVSVYVPTKLSEFTNDKNFISAVPDAYKTYSATVEALSDDGYATEDMLMKIRLDGTDTTEFNVVHISRDEYAAKVKADDGSILSNTLYVISAESINAYGQQLKNLAAPTDLSDAVTLEYADGRYLTAHQSLDNYYTKSQTDALSTTFRNGLATTTSLTAYETKADLTSNYYTKNQTNGLSTTFRSGLVQDTRAINGKALSDDVILEIPSISVDSTQVSSFEMKHVSTEEYAQILEEGALSNVLYVVSSDVNDMMGERVTNVADPVELSDAATKNYVDNNIDKYILTAATLAECGDGLSCQVSNYTITTVAVPDPDTAISIMLPEQTSDNTVRDFMIRFENTGSNNANIMFVPADSEDIDYEGAEDDWAVVEPGVNLISFTETKR